MSERSTKNCHKDIDIQRKKKCLRKLLLVSPKKVINPKNNTKIDIIITNKISNM